MEQQRQRENLKRHQREKNDIQTESRFLSASTMSEDNIFNI